MPEEPSAPSTPPPGPDEMRQETPSSQLGHSDDHPSAGDRPSTLLDRDPTLGYATFDLAEVAIVLSHYDLGVVQAVREFRRGSRHSPKLLIKSDKGAFILKRRAHGRDDPIKVAFCHNLQRTLARARYPLPRLALTAVPPSATAPATEVGPSVPSVAKPATHRSVSPAISIAAAKANS